MLRLQKFLAQAGLGSRRSCEQLIKESKVYVNGAVATIGTKVSETDEIILSTDKGSIMRCAVKEIRVAGRNTQGVRIKKLSGNEKVVSVIKIEDNIH